MTRFAFLATVGDEQISAKRRSSEEGMY